MKKISSIIAIMAIAGVAAFADQITAIALEVGTTGPDTYADGTQVEVGELYRIVYVPAGATFGGFNYDGTLKDSTGAVRVIPEDPDCDLAKRLVATENGNCPSATVVESLEDHLSGDFLLVLLDTRGPSGQILNYTVPASAKVSIFTSTELAAQAPASVDTPAGLPADTVAPTITSFVVNDGKVSVTADDNRTATPRIRALGESAPMPLSYVLQESDDMKTWTAVSRTESASDATIKFNDLVVRESKDSPKKFFRIVVGQ